MQSSAATYLELMGIERWQLRTSPIDAYAVTQGDVRVLLLTMLETESQHQLWQKIIAALASCQVTPVSMTLLNQADVCAGYTKICVFGEVPLAQLKTEALMQTHSLAAMLQQPTLKAEVWQLLKTLLSL